MVTHQLQVERIKFAGQRPSFYHCAMQPTNQLKVKVQGHMRLKIDLEALLLTPVYRVGFLVDTEWVTCALGRYVRHLDSTIHAIQIKTKVCQLVEAMMLRRDDLTFRQEMKFRNKLVEYLTDWIMGNSHQLNIQGDVFTMSRF